MTGGGARQFTIELPTRGRGFYDIGGRVNRGLGDGCGVCHLFVLHTSASLLITENADPEVHRDLERFFARLVPDGDALFRHTAEGPDDMPAHVRSALTQTSLSVPFTDGRLALGTWQGVYLWEHRHSAHTRRVVATAMQQNNTGEPL